MRVTIITPARPLHHRYFCAYLAERHDVVAVVHPVPPSRGTYARVRREGRRIARLGLVDGPLPALARAPAGVSGWSRGRALRDADSRFFRDASDYYERVGVDRVARTVQDINSPESIALVRELASDVVVCHGGPIYGRGLIEACGTMLNFHSGISPVYNGASTVMFAFANGHVQLCGGTLMTMSTTVDGGEILAHYLPAIEADDDPASLFMKTVRGAAHVYSSFLAEYEERRSFTSVRQTPPLYYCTSGGWTLHETRQVRRHLVRQTAGAHVREERMVPYWNCTNDEEAGRAMRGTIDALLGFT